MSSSDVIAHAKVESVESQNVAQEVPPTTARADVPKAAVFQAENEQEKSIVTPLTIENQASANASVNKESKQARDIPAVFSNMVTDNTTELFRPETIEPSGSGLSVDMNLPEVENLQIGTRPGKHIVESENTEKRVYASRSVAQAPQPVSDVPHVFSEVVTDPEIESIKPQAIHPTTSDVTTNMEVPKVVTSQGGIRLEQSIVGLERQTNSTTDISSMNAKPVERTESAIRASSNFESVPQTVITTGHPPKSADLQTAFGKIAKASSQMSSSVPPSDVELSPISLRADSVTKVDPGKDVSKAKQITSADEKNNPMENQQEANKTFESAAMTSGPSREAVEVDLMAKGKPREINPHAVEVMEQVLHKLHGRLQSGPSSMHLQLNPEELGAINVEVIRDSQGVSVTFFAEQTSTGKLLETQLNQLRQSLVDSGVQLSGLNIGQHNHSGQEGGFPNQNTDFAQHSPREAPQSRANTTENPRAERVTGQMSEVDYLI
jgi:flagellar hook-length control protein FliK